MISRERRKNGRWGKGKKDWMRKNSPSFLPPLLKTLLYLWYQEREKTTEMQKFFFSKDGQYFTILQKHTMQPLLVHNYFLFLIIPTECKGFQYFYALWVDHCGMGSLEGHRLELRWASSDLSLRCEMNIQQVKLLVQRMQLFGVLPCSLPSINVVYFLSLNEGHYIY